MESNRIAIGSAGRTEENATEVSLMRLSHREWAERKARDLEDERYEKSLEERRASLQKKAREQKSKRSFEAWLKEKENFERAVQLLGKLGDRRCTEPDLWFEVAVSLNAVDCLRGVYKKEEFRGLPTDRRPEHDLSREELKKAKTLEDEFFKWSRRAEKGHEFENVPCDDALAKTFSSNAQEIMSEYAEQIDRPGEYIVPNLKYSIPKVKQAKTDKRNLHNPDVVKHNKIYNKLLRIEYNRAKTEMYARLDEAISKAPSEVLLAEAERRALNWMGLTKLAKWVEDDLIQQEQILESRKKEDREYAQKMHKSFVKKKDSMKIRLPAENEEDKYDDDLETFKKSKKILYGNQNGSTLRNRAGSGTATVDLLARSASGSKYAYATSKRDLDMARTTLAEEGHVFRENFRDEDGDPLDNDYRMAKAAESKRHRLERLVREREEKAQETYKAWSQQKDIKEKALRALKLIDPPGQSGQGPANDEAHWRFVGEQLKGVDQTLFQEFLEWSRDFKSSSHCKMLWDSLPPTICDTCLPSSAVHKVLLKFLNRPGMNFAEIFDFAVDRQLKKYVLSDGRELSNATPSERKKVEESLELTPKQFRMMMKDAGIGLQANEIRILSTLFDQNGDGKISRKEFLQFTGYDPRPGARGDALKVLRGGGYCCWEACCHVSGLKNAYDVIPADNVNNIEDQNDEDYYTTDEENNPSKNITRSLPLVLRSGNLKEGWRRIPLPDLEKRAQRLVRKGYRERKNFKTQVPKNCQLSKWKNEDRLQALDGLEALADKNRGIFNEVTLRTNGEAPLAPVLQSGDINQIQENERHSSLILQWRAPEESMLPSFFVLETCGKEGSKAHRAHNYKEVFRDPSSAAESEKQACQFVMKDLEAGTMYHFRIRAFNGFGASPFTYAVLVTAPEVPRMPSLTSITSSTVTLAWGGAENERSSLVRRLRDVFRINSTGRKTVDARTLLNTLETEHQELVELLDELPCGSAPGSSVLERIESYISNEAASPLSWSILKKWVEDASIPTELQRMRKKKKKQVHQPGVKYLLCRCVSDEEVDFTREGALPANKNTTTNGDDVSFAVLKSSRWFLNRASDSGVEAKLDLSTRFALPQVLLKEMPEEARTAKEKPALKVVLAPRNQSGKRRESLEATGTTRESGKGLGNVGLLKEPISHLEIYETLYRGSEPNCILTGLEPEKTYQFRVVKLQYPKEPETGKGGSGNIAPPVVSRMGPALIVNMPAVAPPAPRIKDTISADSVTLHWGRPDLDKIKRKSKAKESIDAKRDDWNHAIDQWARDEEEEEQGGVSAATIRKMFMRYDANADGFMDAEELTDLFQDLGLRSCGAVFEESVQELDSNNDGKITYQEFAAWWTKQKPLYVLLHRKEPEEGTFTAWSLVYRGEHPETRVTNLEPNMRHHFALQVEMKRNASAISSSVLVFTAPETPSQPVVIESGPKHCRLKWYPGARGAFKYVLEAFQVEKLPEGSLGPSKTGQVDKNGTWEQIFDGKSNVAMLSSLQPSTVYRLRVRALNKEGISSTPSLPAQFATAITRKSVNRLVSRKNAANYFRIECTGNLVVGDSILFTERVMDKNLHTFITERTVAAKVVGELLRKKGRELVLEVLWSTVSLKKTAAANELSAGVRITRAEAEIFKFETFRAAWEQEDARWSHEEELEAGISS